MNYRVLVLPPTAQMTPEVLRQVARVGGGWRDDCGARPANSPSLLRYPEADREVRDLATDLWGDMDGVTDTQHAFGKGMVYQGLALDEALSRLKDRPDFASSGGPELRRHGFIAALRMRTFILW